MSTDNESPLSIPPAPVGWVKLWHPAGVLVSLPVPTILGPMQALGYVGECLAAGWLANAPGLEEGETKQEIGYVVMREKENADRTVTPMMDLYPADDGMKYSCLTIYLNTKEQRDHFEAMSGLKLMNLQAFIGENKIERGAKRTTDALVYKVKRPFAVVYKPNPKYDPDEKDPGKKKPKRLFVRWIDNLGQPTAGQAEQPKTVQAPDGGTADERKRYAEWAAALRDQDPSLEDFNDHFLRDYFALPKGWLRDSVWQLLWDHASIPGWQYDRGKRCYYRPDGEPGEAPT